MKNAVYLAPRAWPPLRDAPDVVGLKVWTAYEMAIWAGGLGIPPNPFLGAAGYKPAWQATGRASCAYVHTLTLRLSFVAYHSFSFWDCTLPPAILRLFLAFAASRSF